MFNQQNMIMPLNHNNIHIAMKVDALVQHAEEMVLINESQAKKIKFLEGEKQKFQSYIKDLQESLYLNKQSISFLAENQSDQAVLRLNQENKNLRKQVHLYNQQLRQKNALILIEQQLRVEEKKFYNERLIQFENTMSDLRKYLQDKEDSFTTVVNRLRKYEDLKEVIIKDKTHQFKNELQKPIQHELLKKTTEERDKYKKLYEQTKPQIDKLSIIKSCLANEAKYEQLKICFTKFSKEQLKVDEKIIPNQQRTKNTTSASNPQSPNKDLIQLLKKEKLSNQILEEALNEAIEKNEQLLNENILLSDSLTQSKYQIQKLQAKLYVLERHLAKYDLTYKWKSQWKVKCDIDEKDYDYDLKDKGNEEEVHLEGLMEDVEQISKYLYMCVPKAKLNKSCSEPRLVIKLEEDDLEIEEI